MNKIRLTPIKCNICGGDVVYVTNDRVYGNRYGSGYCYLCIECKAYVGTHEPRPKEALGLLGNKEMRDKKMMCHDMFDMLWKNETSGRNKKRQSLYRKLAEALDISMSECHFGYFDIEMLDRAYEILKTW